MIDVTSVMWHVTSDERKVADECCYGVASIIRLFKIARLFCKRAL